MFIQTEVTPNPDALKFIPVTQDQKIVEQEVHFSSLDDANNSFLARKLFAIQGVKNVFFGTYFITVTKLEDSSWNILKAEVIMIIMQHFDSGLSAFDVMQDVNDQNQIQLDLADYTEIEKQIIDIINTRVRPAVAQDGGDIVYKSFQNGVVKLELKGACAGCPSSTMTLKNGIESMLKHYIPEVKEVQADN